MEPCGVTPSHHQLIPLNRNYVLNKTSVSEMDDLIPFHRRRATPTPPGNVHQHHHHHPDTGGNKFINGTVKIGKVNTARTKHYCNIFEFRDSLEKE